MQAPLTVRFRRPQVLVHSSDSGMQDTVSYHSILSHAVESLSSAALKSLTITRLILTNTEIGDDGVASLVLGLRGLPALKVRARILCLRPNITSHILRYAAAPQRTPPTPPSSRGTPLNAICRTQALDLSDNAGMTWRSCVPLAELVDTGHRNDFRYPKHAVIGCGVCCLRTLVLNGLPIGARGIELLAPRLHRNKSLKTLSLQRTGLKRQSANALSLMLQENIGLQVPHHPPAGCIICVWHLGRDCVERLTRILLCCLLPCLGLILGASPPVGAAPRLESGLCGQRRRHGPGAELQPHTSAL